MNLQKIFSLLGLLHELNISSAGPHGPTPAGMGRKQRKMKSGPSEIAQNFIEYRRRGKYDRYHKKFAFWEGFNLVTVFASMCVTHWILNYKFMNYGMEVSKKYFKN